MQQAYTGAHYLERSTPILGLCHGVFTERFIFRPSFRGKLATRIRLGNTIHETRRKKWRPYAGTSSYQKYSNSAFLLLYSSIQILPFLIYLTILCKFLTFACRADHRFIFELFSSQEQSVKVRKGNFATQDLTEAVQQNEESFPRSLNNATLSNWASILSNLGYFCEVRSIIVVCGKIHDAFCRFDH